MRTLLWLGIFMGMLAGNFSAYADALNLSRGVSASSFLSPTKSCQPTVAIKQANQHYPKAEQFYTGNNLVQPAGKVTAFPGQHVRIKGRLLDSRCMPVPNALIELWQTDGQGQYRIANRAMLATPGAVFTGSGRATTNYQGEFEFVTLFPEPTKEVFEAEKTKTNKKKAKKSKKKKSKNKSKKSPSKEVETASSLLPPSATRAPWLHIKVRHDSFPPLMTLFFFADDRRNAQEPLYKALSMDEQQQLTMPVHVASDDTLDAQMDIVLPGRVPFVSY